MTPRQQRFVEEYLRTPDAGRAATLAGYAARGARNCGWRLLRQREVAAAIAAEEKRRAEGRILDADRVVQELMRVAFSDIRQFARWEKDRLVLAPRDQLAPGDTAAIAQLKPGGKLSGPRIRLHGKRRALKALALHVGLFDETAFADPLDMRARAARLRALLLAALEREERAAASPAPPQATVSEPA